MRDVWHSNAGAASSERMMRLLLLMRRLPVVLLGLVGDSQRIYGARAGRSLAVPPTLRMLIAGTCAAGIAIASGPVAPRRLEGARPPEQLAVGPGSPASSSATG